MTSDSPRAQLIHIETDRRLGHEWDEWDGKPLPGNGDFSAPPGVFLRYAGLTLALVAAGAAALIFVLAPRLAAVAAVLPSGLWLALAVATALAWLWFAVLFLSFYGNVLPLPEGWLERGPYLRLMSLTSHVARAFGKRDWVEHAAIDVYNTLAERRRRRVGKGELLVLIPRCLSKQALDGVLAIAGRYEVPVVVGPRGQHARRVSRGGRPRAGVAVACGRGGGRRDQGRGSEAGRAGDVRVLPGAELPWQRAVRDAAVVAPWAAGLGAVPRRLHGPVAHGDPRPLQALGRHQIRERRRDALG